MSIIICGGYSAYHTCDAVGCHNESNKYRYKDNIVEIDKLVRNDGWYVSFLDDKSYCPAHSPYNSGNVSTVIPK